MSNWFYLLSSLFFLVAAIVYVANDASVGNWLNFTGAVLFVLAATTGLLFGRRRTSAVAQAEPRVEASANFDRD